MKNLTTWISRLVVLGIALPGLVRASAVDWRTDYAVAEGFRIQRDVVGLHMPTAIAFVPHPGPGPKDPLYFVTELRGALKVVTNDRTVYIFADGFQHLVPQKELPDHLGEIGMAGICLEPEHGYVFVSYAYEDANSIYRNAIMRFDTKPGVFAIKPTSHKRLATVLDGFLSNVAHQIGGLAVQDGKLFASLGDGYSPVAPLNLDFPGGKVLHMTFDGMPAPDNPFKVDDDPMRIRNYVWAYGFRNPFSLWAKDGRLFGAENGLDLDRFYEVKRGANYLYNGNHDATASNAIFVWTPAVSPVQMGFGPPEGDVSGFPESWRNKFYFALAGSPGDGPGPDPRRKCVVTMGFDFESSRLSSLPAKLLRYTGKQRQLIVGLAFGPDGLYVAPMFPDAEGVTAILHVDYKPEAAHPYPITTPNTALDIMNANQCLGCHKIDGQGLGNNGPALSRGILVSSLLARLDTPAYVEQVKQIDELTTEPFIHFRKARAEILAAQGTEKVRLWIKNRVLDPRFDRTVCAMPKVGLTEAQADIVSTWLVDSAVGDGFARRVNAALHDEKKRSLLIFALGGLLGVLGTLFVMSRLRRKRA